MGLEWCFGTVTHRWYLRRPWRVESEQHEEFEVAFNLLH